MGEGWWQCSLIEKHRKYFFNKKVMQCIQYIKMLLDNFSLLLNETCSIHWGTFIAEGFSVFVLTVKATVSNACPFIRMLGVFHWVLQIFQSIVLTELCFLSSTRNTVATQLTFLVSLPLLVAHENQLKIKSIGQCAKEGNEVLHISTLKKKKMKLS